ncbi:hypothetical protein WJX82_002001 [Trebouxia sp. C0006]
MEPWQVYDASTPELLSELNRIRSEDVRQLSRLARISTLIEQELAERGHLDLFLDSLTVELPPFKAVLLAAFSGCWSLSAGGSHSSLQAGKEEALEGQESWSTSRVGLCKGTFIMAKARRKSQLNIGSFAHVSKELKPSPATNQLSIT